MAARKPAAPVQISAYDLSFELKVDHAGGGGADGGGGGGADGDGADAEGSDAAGSDAEG